jgi:hypothetical protein
MPTVAENYIAEFEAGKRFSYPATGLVSNKKMDASAVEILRKKLPISTPQVREDIVQLLADVGFQLSEQHSSRVVIDDPKIIAILANEAFTKHDVGMYASVDILRSKCTEESLRLHNRNYVEALEKLPSGSLLLLIAKAKALEANITIKRLIDDPSWKNEQYLKIAQAALGDTVVEDIFIKKAKDASEANKGQELAEALRLLGLIGTRRSLLTVASYMRTPVNEERPRFKRSVRLKAIEALKYNYPGALVLNYQGIDSQKDYDAAEKFITEKLGYVFEGPPPAFFTNQPFPVPMPPRQ